MAELISVFDYEKQAKQLLSKELYDYIAGGSFDELTVKNNRKAFDSIQIKPLCLRNVSKLDLTWFQFGKLSNMPLMIAPTAYHQLLVEQGEISTARVAKECGLTMVVSSFSSKSMEEISQESKHQNLWLQIYLFKNRSLTENLVQRAVLCGYKGIVLTVGVPVLSKRERDLKNGFQLPQQIQAANFVELIPNKKGHSFLADELDDSISWDDVNWLQSITSLPIILKGILNPVDAQKACELNLSGIIVSNHGGRQLDTAISTIEALAEIVNAVNGRLSVMLDSGIRRGSDIFKAIAMGADAVLLGRPILWSLAVNGESGLKTMLVELREEFETVMKLSGCSSIEEIKSFGKYLIS